MDVNAAELRISKLLRNGVLFTAFCFATGLFLKFLLYPNYQIDFSQYAGTSLAEHWREAWKFGFWGVIVSYIGFFVLVSLPIMRVFLTAFLFLKQRDFVLSAMAFFVFAVLVLSFFLGVDLG